MVTETKVERRLIAQIYAKVDGVPVEQELLREGLTRAIIESSAHLPDMATLQFHNTDLRLSEAERFKLGQELRIELGDQQLKREVFVGEVTDLELGFDTLGQTPLTVRAYDRAHRLHRGRFTRAFKQMTDSDIARQIARELSFDADIEPTSEVHEYLLQDNQTNWEFLQERALRLGFELLVRDKMLVFKPPPGTESEPIHLTWAGELHSFHARMVSGGQVDEVRVRGWDPINKKAIEGSTRRTRRTFEIGERREGGAVASEAFHREAKLVVAREAVYSQAQAEALAQAVLDELGNSFVLAEGSAMGDPRIRLGSEVTVERAGKQFSGTYVVTEVRHIYEEGYRIEFRATGRRSTDLLSLLAPPARPAIHVLTGIVTNNRDERDLGRVKVKLSILGEEIESHWCRVVNPGAGPDRGLEYLPEVDDEVLLIGSDINHLYVLGGLWNTQDLPPQKNSQAVAGGRVTKRIIRSRTGHVILLDDSDGGGGITIVDSTEKNKFTIDTARNNLELVVEGDMKLKAGGKVEIVAGTEAKIEAGTDLTAEAGAQLDLKGAAAARLQSNARAEVSAPSVNIGQ